MAQLLHVDRLTKLTLTRKGKAVAKHPLLRSGVVETVKASALEEGEENSGRTEGQEVPEAEVTEPNWYTEFEGFIEATPDDAIPDNWEAAFQVDWEAQLANAAGELVEKAKAKRKNYPDSQGPFAGPHNSFPIRNQSDVYDAARLIGHAQNPAAVKARIMSIARSKGYSLPKSWQSKASKSLEKLSLKDLAERLAELASGEETPAEEPVEEGGQEPVEKARPGRKSMHSHVHSHLSHLGYSYSHQHDHGHDADGMANHETSEVAHAHEHVSKATEDVTSEEILANQAGLQQDILALKALIEGVQQKLDEGATKQEEALKAIEDKRAEAEAAITEKTEAIKAVEVSEARKPLTLGAPTGTSRKVTPDMKFDDAFNRLMHGSAE